LRHDLFAVPLFWNSNLLLSALAFRSTHGLQSANVPSCEALHLFFRIAQSAFDLLFLSLIDLSESKLPGYYSSALQSDCNLITQLAVLWQNANDLFANTMDKGLALIGPYAPWVVELCCREGRIEMLVRVNREPARRSDGALPSLHSSECTCSIHVGWYSWA
jgi:hypothetical protein